MTRLLNFLSVAVSRFQRRLHGQRKKVTQERTECISTYSQCGEDVIIAFAFQLLGIVRPFYLDIGSYCPYRLSNTYLFYERGSRGVCVEANPALINSFTHARPRDLILNAGIVPSGNTELQFFEMSPNTLSTFDATEAARMQNEEGHTLVKTIMIPTMSINDVIDRHCNKPPDLICVDTEGMDYAIVESFRFDVFRPAVFCVETVSYSSKGAGVKDDRFSRLFQSHGYFQFADTYVNSIFVDRKAWCTKYGLTQ